MKRIKYLLIFLLLISQAFVSAYGQEIKVACIGNSITYGTGLDADPVKRKLKSYPYKLQESLNAYYSGKTFKVTNYAVPGTTMLKDPNDEGALDDKQWSYWELKHSSKDGGGKVQYDLALADKPDIVIIKFGTNDARGEVWRSAEGYGKNNFYKHYVEFINSFRNVNQNVIIYICLPTPSFRDQTTDQRRRISEEVIPIIKQVARKNKVHLIDLHAEFYDGASKLLILGDPDLVHPTEEGATLIAQEVFKMIKMTYKP